MGRLAKTTPDALRLKYQELQAKKRYLHAEVQLMVALNNGRVEDAFKEFPYLGCSKEVCYLCSALLQCGGIRYHSCHCKIYPRWTVPETEFVSRSYLVRFESYLRSFGRLIRETIYMKVNSDQILKRQNMRPEASAGVSTADTVFPQAQSYTRTPLIKLNHNQEFEEHLRIIKP